MAIEKIEKQYERIRGSCRVSVSQIYILLSLQKAFYVCAFLYFQLLKSLTSFKAFLDLKTKNR